MTAPAWPDRTSGGTRGEPDYSPAMRVRRDGRGFAVYLPALSEPKTPWAKPWRGYSMTGERDYTFDNYFGQVWGPVWSYPFGPGPQAPTGQDSGRALDELADQLEEAHAIADDTYSDDRRCQIVNIHVARLRYLADQHRLSTP